MVKPMTLMNLRSVREWLLQDGPLKLLLGRLNDLHIKKALVAFHYLHVRRSYAKKAGHVRKALVPV